MKGIESKLPSGWTSVALGKICNPLNGRAFKSTEWRGKGIPIIRIRNLKVAEAPFNYYQGDLDEKHHVTRGDLLFAWSGTPGTSFGAHIWCGSDAALNQHIFRVDFREDLLDSKFFCAALNLNVVSYVSQAQGGVGLAHITKRKFLASKIVLPPLAEQQRIVAAIETQLTRLDAAVASLKRVRANLKRARASVLKAAVEGRLVPSEAELARREGRSYENASVLLERILEERLRRHEERQAVAGRKKKYQPPVEPEVAELGELPEGWVWATLQQVGEPGRPFSYGVLVPGKHVDNGVPLVRVGDIGDGVIADRPEKSISKSVADHFKRTYLAGGELLLSIVGTIGRAGLAPQSLAGANVARAVAVLPLSGSVDSQFVLLAIRSPAVRQALVGAAHEVARKTLNMEDVRSACIPLPPLREQTRIAIEVSRQVSVLDAIDHTVEHNLRRCERLRQSILKRAFEGKLVPQDPNDEPASELLARIQAGL